MDEKYRLVFRGEVLDGQHRAVVKRRLMESLKLTDEQGEKLFSGSSVVLKKSVEAKVAAHYQALFKQAGGRLRVHPIGQTTPAAATAEDTPASPARSAGTAETSPPAAVEIDAAAPESGSSFTLISQEEVDRAVARAKTGPIEITAPEFSLAELGADLGEATEQVIAPIPEVEFSLADAGALLGVEKSQEEVVIIGDLDFEVAAVGTTLVEPGNEPVPPAPDVSHLQLAEEAQA
jgi:hypothetical protein